MKLSFEGVRANALRELRELKTVAMAANEQGDDEPQTLAIECCISAYHDCLLAVMRGDVPVDEIRGFLLAFKTDEEIKAIPFCGEVVSFEPKESGK